LISEPATAQVAKKTVTEKSARRVRGAIDRVTSKAELRVISRQTAYFIV
jgi:CRISPR/Cas system CSM-associated protein Csm3 (group 7 of RAMP superfamily)